MTVETAPTRRELRTELDAAEREHREASQAWRELEEQIAVSQRGKRVDEKGQEVRLDAAEHAVALADLDGARPEAGRRLLDTRARLMAAKIGYANHELTGLVQKFNGRAAHTGEARERLRRALVEVAVAVWAFGDATSEERQAARGVVEMVLSTISDGDARRAITSDSHYQLPTHLGADGNPDDFLVRERGLYGDDDDDPATLAFWDRFGELIRGGPQRLDGRAGRSFAAALTAALKTTTR
jgi:hypothetical protein